MTRGQNDVADGVSARRPKDRKATIVDAAAELFAQRGFAAVGVDDIGAEVGVTGPAIYRHYRGKDAVLVAVLERTAESLARAVDEAAAGAAGGTRQVDRLVRAAVGFILDEPALTAAYLRERPRLTHEQAQPLVAAERRIRRTWLAAMRSTRPDLDDVRAVVRRQAMVGALVTAARSHRDVVRPRLDDLLVASAVGVLTAPVTPAPAVEGARAAASPAPAKRDEIMAAALALFRLRGVSGVGVDEIGETAGISGPTLYHYFPSKADIVLDAYERAGERVAAGVDDALDRARSPDDALERLARSYVQVASESVDLIVVTSREASALPESARRRIDRRGRGARDAWAGVLQQVRPDLAEPEVRLLVRSAFALVNHAVEAAEGHRGLEPEIAALATAHLRHRSRGNGRVATPGIASRTRK